MSGDQSNEYMVDARSEEGWETKGIPGHTIKVLFENEETEFSISLVRFKKGVGVPKSHKHASNQFMYCLEGEYEYTDTGNVLKPGTFYVNPKDSVHGPTIAREDALLVEIYDGPAYYERPDFYAPENRPADAEEESR